MRLVVLRGSGDEMRPRMARRTLGRRPRFQPQVLEDLLDHRGIGELVLESGRFAINLPCRALADLAYTVGSTSGRDGDKFARYGIASFAGPMLGLPLIEGCVGWLECRRIAEPHSEAAYDTFFGEVVSAQADLRVFANGRWDFRVDNAGLHKLHHLGGGSRCLRTPCRGARSTDYGRQRSSEDCRAAVPARRSASGAPMHQS
jgi:Flavin reductase like domain